MDVGTPTVTYEPDVEYAIVLSGPLYLGFQIWADTGSISASAAGLSQTACMGTRITHLGGKVEKNVSWGFWTAPTSGHGDVSFNAAVVIDYETFTIVSGVVGEHTPSIELAPADVFVAAPVALNASTPRRPLPAAPPLATPPAGGPIAPPSIGAIAYAHAITLSPELLVEFLYAPPSIFMRLNSSSGGWASLSLNPSAEMIGGDAVLIQPAAVERVQQVFITDETAEGVVPVSAHLATIESTTFELTESGWTSSWSRPLSSGSYVNAQSVGAQSTMTAAWGAPNDVLMAYHGPRVTAVNIIFTTGYSASVILWVNSGLLAHGALMFAAFGVFFPLGAFIARWGKNVTFCGGKAGAWFRAHRLIQTFGCALLIAGLACAIQAVGNAVASRHFITAHARLGLGLAVFSLLQPLNALVRPHAATHGEAKSLARRVWEGAHKGGGWAALALAAPATLILGLTRRAPALLPAYYALVAASALTALACLLRERRRTLRSGPPSIVVTTVSSPTSSNEATKRANVPDARQS